MLDLLHRLPDAAAFTIICGLLVGAVAAAPKLGQRLGIRQDEERSAGALEAFKSVAAAAVIVLAFSLAQVQATLRSTQEAVGKEAAAIAALDRAFARSGRAEIAALRPALRRYGGAIVTEEWPLVAQGGRSAAVTEHATLMLQVVRSADPGAADQAALTGAMLRHLDEMSELREARLLAGTAGLPPLFYAVVLGLCGIMILLSLLVAPTASHALHLSGMAGTAALLLSLVTVVDRPFSGDTQVSAQPILQTLEHNAERM